MDTRSAAKEAPSENESTTAKTTAKDNSTIRFTSSPWPLFKIWFGNLLLPVITLSPYCFWDGHGFVVT